MAALSIAYVGTFELWSVVRVTEFTRDQGEDQHKRLFNSSGL